MEKQDCATSCDNRDSDNRDSDNCSDLFEKKIKYLDTFLLCSDCLNKLLDQLKEGNRIGFNIGYPINSSDSRIKKYHSYCGHYNNFFGVQPSRTVMYMTARIRSDYTYIITNKTRRSILKYFTDNHGNFPSAFSVAEN